MELCSHNHEEVCFSGRSCPVCELIDDHAEALAELKEKVETAEQQAEEQQAVAQSYKEKWQASEAEVTRLCNGQLDGER